MSTEMSLLLDIRHSGRVSFIGADNVNVKGIDLIDRDLHALNQSETTGRKFHCTLEDINREYDTVLYSPGKYDPNDVIMNNIIDAKRVLSNKGVIYVALSTRHGGKVVYKMLVDVFGNANKVCISKGIRLQKSVKLDKRLPEKEDVTKEITFPFRGRQYKFVTERGLFSYNSIDEGTKLLVENAQINGKVLDLGCGYGALGILLADRADHIDMVDCDIKAVKLSRENANRNNIVNVSVFPSDGFSNIKRKYDYIVSNPPTHANKEFLFKLFLDVHRSLEKEGKMYIVVNEIINYERILGAFKEVSAIARGGKYKILSCSK